jgi:hypothetical protein
MWRSHYIWWAGARPDRTPCLVDLHHVVFVLTGAMVDVLAKFLGNGLGIAGVSVGGDLLGLDLGDRPGGAGKNSLEEMLLGN